MNTSDLLNLQMIIDSANVVLKSIRERDETNPKEFQILVHNLRCLSGIGNELKETTDYCINKIEK